MSLPKRWPELNANERRERLAELTTFLDDLAAIKLYALDQALMAIRADAAELRELAGIEIRRAA